MSTFQVQDMTCGHCASTITKAVLAAHPQAKIAVYVASRRVEVTDAAVKDEQIRQAIEQAGYTPVLLQPGSPAATANRGCCCG